MLPSDLYHAESKPMHVVLDGFALYTRKMRKRIGGDVQQKASRVRSPHQAAVRAGALQA
jgi:hypothetical protein